jgi:hypothetical protein
MGPRDQEGYSQVPSAAAAAASVGQEDVHAEASFLLSPPTGISFRTSSIPHNNRHRKERWIHLYRNACCCGPRTRRRKNRCVSAEVRFRILGVSIMMLLLGFLVAVSPIHYSDMFRSSQDICGSEPDPIMRLKSSSTCKYVCNKSTYRREDRHDASVRHIGKALHSLAFLSYRVNSWYHNLSHQWRVSDRVLSHLTIPCVRTLEK